MQKSCSVRLFALVSPASLMVAALGQTSAGSVSDCPDSNCSAMAASNLDQTSATVKNQPELYASALNGSGPISLISSLPARLTFGVDVSGGYDSNPNNDNTGVASAFTALTPYVGLRFSTPRAQTLLQYTFADTIYSASYSSKTFHAASLHHLHNVTDRWSIDLDASGNYGQNNVRFLGSQETSVVGNVQGLSAEAASYLDNAGNVTNLSATLGATYLSSPTDSVRLQFTEGTTRFSGLSETNSVATETISFARELSPRLEISLYAQGSHYYGSVRCDSIGSGVGIAWSPDEKTTIVGSGGPQLDAPNCGAQEGAAFSVTFTHKLNGRSSFFLLTSRAPGTSFLGPGLWQDSASTGYSHQVRKTGALRFNLAFLHSSNLTGSGSYDPIYVDGGYERDLHRAFHASVTYRSYRDLSGSTPGSNRNVAMFSLAWSPDQAVTPNR